MNIQSNKIESLNIHNKSKVLLVYPHPDDETFANAGLILKLRKQNIKVYVLCLTKGEASTLKFGLKNNQDLSHAREEEFKNVMSYLNVNNYKMENFKDGGLETQEIEVSNSIKNYINQAQPTHIVTFEPCGVYGHPDHIFISKLLTNLCNEKNIELIYSTVASDFQFTKDTLGMAKDPSAVKPLSPNVILTLSIKEYFQKVKALSLYKTQVKFNQNLLQTLHQLKFIFKEYYVIKQELNNKETLINYLKQKGIPVQDWGQIRTVDHLLNEFQNKESYLTEEGGKVIRNINVVSLIIKHNNKYLLQYKQEFDSGANTDRKKFPSEKMIAGENMEQYCKRLLKEELQIECEFNFKQIKETEIIEPTKAYPGLYNKILMQIVEVKLPSNLTLPKEFIEEEKGKQKTYFKWFDSIEDIQQ